MLRLSLPRPRQLWRQVHWFAGLTLGTLLMLIGLTGATLSFREEITDLLNPGVRHVAVRQQAALTPPQLLVAVQHDWPGREVGTLTVFATAGSAARVIFTPQNGQQRGETIYLDPYTGRTQPPVRGSEFFETVESLHRWLLLPREPGRVAAGTLALALLGLALSGLYVRWPRQWRSWRAWLSIAPNLQGRALLSRWHMVLGTCVLPLYLISTATGIYWSFDAVRTRLDTWIGSEPRPAPKPRTAQKPAKAEKAARPPKVDITEAWTAFEQRAHATGGWSEAIVRISGKEKSTMMVTWLDAVPAHERARNRMSLSLPQVTVMQDERHAEKTAGGRFLVATYPLHMGTYFGLPGRIVMTMAALLLPAFGITGWWLYLDRRRKRQQSKTRQPTTPQDRKRYGIQLSAQTKNSRQS